MMSPMEQFTPTEIRQRQFATAWRGFKADEVMAFLNEVADAYASLMQKIDSLQADLERQEAELSGLKRQEGLLKETLIRAQQVIESMTANAKRESEIRIHDAELKAEKILQEAFTRQGKIRNDIDELKRLKTTLAAQLRGVLDSHQRLLAETEAAD